MGTWKVLKRAFLITIATVLGVAAISGLLHVNRLVVNFSSCVFLLVIVAFMDVIELPKKATSLILFILGMIMLGVHFRNNMETVLLGNLSLTIALLYFSNEDDTKKYVSKLQIWLQTLLGSMLILLAVVLIVYIIYNFGWALWSLYIYIVEAVVLAIWQLSLNTKTGNTAV